MGRKRLDPIDDSSALAAARERIAGDGRYAELARRLDELSEARLALGELQAADLGKQRLAWDLDTKIWETFLELEPLQRQLAAEQVSSKHDDADRVQRTAEAILVEQGEKPSRIGAIGHNYDAGVSYANYPNRSAVTKRVARLRKSRRYQLIVERFELQKWLDDPVPFMAWDPVTGKPYTREDLVREVERLSAAIAQLTPG